MSKRIILTGGAGFIGSQYLRHLNEQDFTNIIIFDDITPEKLKNINNYQFEDYLDKDFLLTYLETCTSDDFIVHLGADSSTVCKDKQIIEDNAEFTCELINVCIEKHLPLIYASSASVYGHKTDKSYQPLNLYAFSKMLTDKYVEKILESKENTAPIIGLRFFNVIDCGKGHLAEVHKGGQASVVYNWWKEFQQAKQRGQIRPDLKIFEGVNKRDFISVEDICNIIDYFIVTQKSGIYDVGTGYAHDFQEIADIMKERYKCNFFKVPLPQELKDQYQTFTQANCWDLHDYRMARHDKNDFTDFKQMINEYLDKLDRSTNESNKNKTST